MNQLVAGKDVEVIDEGLGSVGDYLQRTSRNAFLHAAALIGSATSGRRGKLATAGLNLAGVTTDSQGISRHYKQHAPVIDAYFEYVDLVALSKKLNVDKTIARKAPPAIFMVVGLLSAGALLGVVATRIYSKKHQS